MPNNLSKAEKDRRSQTPAGPNGGTSHPTSEHGSARPSARKALDSNRESPDQAQPAGMEGSRTTKLRGSRTLDGNTARKTASRHRVEGTPRVGQRGNSTSPEPTDRSIAGSAPQDRYGTEKSSAIGSSTNISGSVLSPKGQHKGHSSTPPDFKKHPSSHRYGVPKLV